MQIEPGNNDQEKKPEPTPQENDKNNEDLAKQIPTVTPDTDNIEPVPDVDTKD